MQFYLPFLYLLIQSSSILSLYCTSQCSQMTLTFNEPFSFSNDCQTNFTDIFVRALVCLIDYRIDYDAKQIYIKLQATNESKTLDTNIPSEFLIQSIWLGFNQQANQPNITHRTYGCNHEDDCGRKFYFKTIERLITDGWIQLEEIKFHLYDSTINKIHCRNNRTIISCPNGLCYVLNIEKKRMCTSDQTATLFTEIEYRLPRNSSNERQLIEYKCNRPYCNGQRMMKEVSKLLLDYTHGKSMKNIPMKSSSNTYLNISYCFHFILFYFVLFD